MFRKRLFSSPENPLLHPSSPLNPNPNLPLARKTTTLPLSQYCIASTLHSPKMGCATSRLESGEEIPSGLVPFMRRLQDLRRTKTDVSRHGRRERKDSIVSTTELLRPEERDIDYYDTAAMEAAVEKDESNGKRSETTALLEIVKEEEEKTESAEERRIGFGRESPADEELPGSPSFRFYCTDPVQRVDTNVGSVPSSSSDSLKRIEEKELLEEKELVEEKEDPNECLVAAEGSECKAIKKEKGRKFMSLPKGNFLNVRGCYNMNCSLHAHEGTRILSQKDT